MRAETLARELESTPCSSWDAVNKEADIYLVAITDTAIFELGRHLSLVDQVVLHTAGSVAMEVLKISAIIMVYYTRYRVYEKKCRC